MRRRWRLLFVVLAALLVTAACNTHKNTSSVRWWKGFKTRYNTYYNAHQAYLEGMEAKRDGNQDNYTDYLPLLMVSNESSRSLGKSNFETTVTKCERAIQLYSIKQKPVYKRGKRLTAKEKEFRNRKEFNPFIKNAWILMGKAQMEQGDFIAAASTFAYTTRLYRTQPKVANVARSLMALCYTELDWFYDAEEALRQVERDSIGRAARRPFNTARTNYYLRQEKWEEALPYLEREVKNTPRGIPRARLYFLLGQVYQELDRKEEAYKAYQKCLRQSPPYELKFNARIAQTEVMSNEDSKRKLSKLRRLARNENNKEYLDRIYYAIGNVYLAMPDTAKAIDNYEKGRAEATKSGPEKGQLLLRLGDVYWAKQRFGRAQECYSEALGLMGEDHDRYREIQEKTSILNKLVPYTDEIFLQDSLQALVRMPEEERLAQIDKLIEAEKERQKAARKAQNDSIAKARAESNPGSAVQTVDVTTSTEASGNWYFYNQQSVQQGAASFKRQWGSRKNEDDWRRSNKTTTSTSDEDETDEAADSLNSAAGDSTSLNADSIAASLSPDSAANDPLKREYYLKNLPFTEEQMAESNAKIEQSLLPAGIIEKDELEDYYLAKSTLNRLNEDFPLYEQRDELLYQLFLLELRWGLPGAADAYRNQLAINYPESKYTLIITASDFEENARYGKHLEDSLYVATYEAFRTSDYPTIERGTAISESKYPEGANRAKFMFIEAMTKLRNGDQAGFLEELRAVATNYTADDISSLAASIVSNVEEGRVPGASAFNLNSLWALRDSLGSVLGDSIALADSLTAGRLEPWLCILPYSTDSVSENKLIYEVSRFNFTHFDIRSFEIELLGYGIMGQMRVEGFQSFDEAHTYIQELFADSILQPLLMNIEPVLISEHNLNLVGTKYTIDEYLDFYQQHFVPSRVKEDLQIDTGSDNFIWDEFEEPSNEYDAGDDEDEWDDDYEDGGEWY